MRTVTRLWFVACCVTLGALALLQAWDAASWALAPWPHFTLRDHGIVTTRGLDEAPPSLKPMLAVSPLVLRDIQPGGEGPWRVVSRAGDPPWAAVGRLRAALDGLPSGTPTRVRVEDASGAVTEADVSADRVPWRIVLARLACFGGVGLCIAVFGLLVFSLRPHSRTAVPFLAFALATGGEAMATQVVGGFPSRLHWLAIALCYVGPPAGLALALSLEDRPWLAQRPWVRHVPWLVVPPAVLLAVVQGSLHDDVGLAIRVLRLSGWAALGLILFALRLTSRGRQESRRLEFFLVGVFLAYAPIIFAYSRPGISDAAPVSPYFMVPLLICPLSIGYGIVTAQLFDIEVVLRRGLALASIVVVAAGTFALLLAAAGTLLGRVEIRHSTPMLATFVAVAFLVGGALRGRLQSLIDRVVNPARFRHAQTLRDAGAELAALSDELDIARRLAGLATEAGGVSTASVLVARDGRFELVARSGAATPAPAMTLSNTEPIVRLATLMSGEIHRHDFDSNPKLRPLREPCLARLDALGADLVFPLSASSGEVLGLLALGGRKDGLPLNVEDVALFRRLSTQAALALELARAAPKISDVPTAASPTRASRPVALAAGTALGHYRLEAQVGRGGMGTVFRALDHRLDRRVALKFLAEDAHDERMLERVRREARVLASLDHPAIVRLHALEEMGGHLFLVMEYLDGLTLKAELDERGAFPMDEALDVADRVAGALDHALSVGVLHRDVKPANVMRARDGTLKLMDFGLARGGDHASLTGSGQLLGTLAFVAPELVMGGRPSPQSDLYALGVMLHALLTGRAVSTDEGRPWYLAGDEIDATVLQQAGVSRPVMALLLRLLRRRPEERPASPAALLAELRDVRRAPPGMA